MNMVVFEAEEREEAVFGRLHAQYQNGWEIVGWKSVDSPRVTLLRKEFPGL
jgi:hypothetical protein